MIHLINVLIGIGILLSTLLLGIGIGYWIGFYDRRGVTNAYKEAYNTSRELTSTYESVLKFYRGQLNYLIKYFKLDEWLFDDIDLTKEEKNGD